MFVVVRHDNFAVGVGIDLFSAYYQRYGNYPLGLIIKFGFEGRALGSAGRIA